MANVGGRKVLVTFDVDGTLMHSVGPLANRLHKRAFSHAMQEIFGIADGTIDVVKHHGSTDPIILVKSLEHYGVRREDALAKLGELKLSMVRYAQEHQSQVGDGLQLLPGVSQLLELLSKRDDVIVGLVTGNLEEIAWMKMASLGILKYFSVPNFGGFGSEHEERGELVKIAAAKANKLFNGGIRLHAHVGDTPSDIMASEYGGALPVGVSTGVFSKDELAKASPLGSPLLLDDLTNGNILLAACGFCGGWFIDSVSVDETSMVSTKFSHGVPRLMNEPLGGFIFVCNDETMPEDFERRLFGLPSNYEESVLAIRSGLPLFLYNYSSRCLHGVFEAASDGGMYLEPNAWGNKDYVRTGDEPTSKFPAQVRVRIRESRQPLEEEQFRPALFHYDGRKFRLELSRTEVEEILKLFGVSSYPVTNMSNECREVSDNANEWEKVKGKNKVSRPTRPSASRTSLSNSSAAGKRRGGVSLNGTAGVGVLPNYSVTSSRVTPQENGFYGRDAQSRADLAQHWRSDFESWGPRDIEVPQVVDTEAEASVEPAIRATTPPGFSSYIAALKSGIPSTATVAESKEDALLERNSDSVLQNTDHHQLAASATSTSSSKAEEEESVCKLSGHLESANILGRLKDSDPAVNSGSLLANGSHPNTGKNFRVGKESFHHHGYDTRRREKKQHMISDPPLVQPLQVHQYVAAVHPPFLSPLQFPLVYQGNEPADANFAGYRPVQRRDADGGIRSPVQQQPSWNGVVMNPFPPMFPLPSPALAANVESNFEALNAEILEFARTARPSPAARALAEAAVECVRRGVKQLWPAADVEVFGSFATGLCLPHSDVDVVVVDAPATEPNTSFTGLKAVSIPLIRALAAAFKEKKWCESSLTIETASMPVLKLRCRPEGAFGSSSVAIDVTIGGSSSLVVNQGDDGVRSTATTTKFTHNGTAAREYVLQKLRQLPALAPLVLLMKSYLHYRGLNDVYSGGLGSFSLTLMLVFYLEHVPVSWSTNSTAAAAATTVGGGGEEITSESNGGGDSDDDTVATDSSSADSSSSCSCSFEEENGVCREAVITRAWRTVDELLASLHSPGSAKLGSLLIGFLHIFGQQLDFARTRLVWKGSSGTSKGMFVLEPNSQPACLWIDDPLRPGSNVGSGSFAMWHVQAAMRDMLFILARPSLSSSRCGGGGEGEGEGEGDEENEGEGEGEGGSGLSHLQQLFTIPISGV